MIEKIKIEKIDRKEGQTDQGKRYTRLGLFANNRWYSGFDNKETEKWNVGDTVEIDVTQNGKYYNFKLLKKETKEIIETQNTMKDILTLVQEIVLSVREIKKSLKIEDKKLEDVNKKLKEESEKLGDDLPF